MDVAASSIWAACWAVVWLFMTAKERLTMQSERIEVNIVSAPKRSDGVYETTRGLNEWEAVSRHGRALRRQHGLRELALDGQRCEKLRTEGPCGLVLDWSRHQVTEETMELLGKWAEARGLESFLEDWSVGKIVNPSESRAALHQRLRAPTGETPAEVARVRDIILRFADDVRSGQYTTVYNTRFDAVIVAGIGGSRLGPEVVVRALADSRHHLQIRFLSTVDGFRDAIQGLDPRSTLVVVSSKSFTTSETVANAKRLRTWLASAGLDEEGIRRHTVACTAQTDQIHDSYAAVFQFWETVGGRFSVSAAPGLLPIALACGADGALRFLAGARAMDLHLFHHEESPLTKRLPVIMALLAIFNARVLGLRSGRCVVPYTSRLALLPAHLQQLEMESLGKPGSIDPTFQHLLFGAAGTDAQHSFFQLLHQSPVPIPTDFIGCLRPPISDNELDDWLQWDTLVANLLAQPDALALGVPDSNYDFYFPGGRPSLTLMLPILEPASLGALMALYEHRTVVLGFLLGVNPFDQPGVELGKQLATTLSKHLSSGGNDDFPPSAADQDEKDISWTPATAWMLQRYNAIRPTALRQNHQVPPSTPPAPPAHAAAE